MPKTAIVAFVEPASYSLENSLVWNVTSSLKSRITKFRVADAANNDVCAVRGVAPILQPIKATVGSQPVFLQFMRAMLVGLKKGHFKKQFQSLDAKYTLIDESRTNLATLSGSLNKKGAALPIVVLSDQFGQLTAPDLAVLHGYVNDTIAKLWSMEPINWTTHKFQLASNGQFLPTDEIRHAKLFSGQLTVDQGTLSIVPGVKPRLTLFKKWRKAGKTTRFDLKGAASGFASCSSSSSSTSSTSTSCSSSSTSSTCSSTSTSGGDTSGSSWSTGGSTGGSTWGSGTTGGGTGSSCCGCGS